MASWYHPDAEELQTTSHLRNVSRPRRAVPFNPISHGANVPLISVSFQRMGGLATNGWSTISRVASSAPDLYTIVKIIDFIRRTIDSKIDKKFYIGRGSYEISGNHANEDPAHSTAVRNAQIGALSNRFDERKINTFSRLLKKDREIEMILVYDTVMNPTASAKPVKTPSNTKKIIPAAPKNKKGNKGTIKITNKKKPAPSNPATSNQKKYIRSHGTMEALLIHLFCGKRPTTCQNQNHLDCAYFHEGTHFTGLTTMRDILCMIQPHHDIDYYHKRFAKHCQNKVAGTINGGLNEESDRNRGIIYYVGLNPKNLG